MDNLCKQRAEKATKVFSSSLAKFISSFQVSTKNWETVHEQVLRTECCSAELPLRVGEICTVKTC